MTAVYQPINALSFVYIVITLRVLRSTTLCPQVSPAMALATYGSMFTDSVRSLSHRRSLASPDRGSLFHTFLCPRPFGQRSRVPQTINKHWSDKQTLVRGRGYPHILWITHGKVDFHRILTFDMHWKLQKLNSYSNSH